MLDVNSDLVAQTEASLPLSVVVAADGDGAGLAKLLARYREALDSRGQAYEFILVFDHRSDGLQTVARQLAEEWPAFVPLPQRPWTGEDTALKLGVDRTVGEVILTLPAWSEVAPSAIHDLLDGMATADMVTGKRTTLERSGLQKLRAAGIHWLLRVLFQQRFDDVFCRARAGRREVFLRSAEMGVRQHFLPLIAASEGYEVHELSLALDDHSDAPPVYRFKPNAHFGAVADVLTLFVALKFLKRPLRFFGAIGVPMIFLGLLLTMILVMERLVFGTALGDRPALVFSIMMLVLGLQIVALGLVGEIIIFSASRRMRSYEIDHIIRGRPEASEIDPAAQAPEHARPPE